MKQKLITTLSILVGLVLVVGGLAFSYEEKEKGFSSRLRTSGKVVEVASQYKDFSAAQTPEFSVKTTRNASPTGVYTFVKGAFAGEKEEDASVKVEVVDANEQIVESLSLEDIGGTFSLPDLKPGNYTLKLVNEDTGETVEQDFSWGVLAINTNKSIYSLNDADGNPKESETAKLTMAVLDEEGDMVCDASLNLQITSPNIQTKTLSTDDGSIKVNEECNKKGFTEVPDFEAEYKVENIGTYSLELTAETDNGTFTISDSFEAVENVNFDVERKAPTRIYPYVEYPAKIVIKANEDFKGVVEEVVPSDFELLDVAEKVGEENEQIILSRENAEVIQEEDHKKIRWHVDWEKGTTNELIYVFDAPDVSPEYYRLGELKMIAADYQRESVTNQRQSVVFEENRKWQIASDATASMILLWDQATPDAPTGWTCISCGSGDFYQKFIRGAADYNATGGGAANHDHTVSTTVNASAASAGENRAGTAISDVNHGHPFSPTISSASNNPSNSTLKVIQFDSTGEPSTIPENAIAFFDTTDGSMPNGDWTRYSTQDGFYIQGENSAGTTGGSNTHNHDISGSLGAADSSNLDTRGGPQTEDVANAGHTHTYPTTSTNDNVNNEPPHIDVVLGQVTNASGTSPPNGMIAMFNKGSGDTYPTNWEDRSGSGQPFNQVFLKPASAYDASPTSPGTSSHNHNDVTGVTSGGPSGVSNGRTGTAGADDLHSHSVDVTNFNSPSHLPPYIDVAFAERNAAIDVSGFLYEKGTTTASNLCDDSTVVLAARVAGATETTSCASADGSFTFSQTAVPSAGDGIVIWIDGQTEDGATVVRYDGSGNSTNNIVYEDVVTVTSDDTNPVDILDMDFYDNGNDLDIPYTATDATPDTLSVNSGFELLVELKSGVANGSDVFDPNGTVTTNATGGLFHVDDNAVAYLDTATNSIGTDITIDTGATLNIDADTTVNGGDITVTGTLATTAGTPTVTMAATGTIGGGGTIAVHDLTVNDTVTTTIGSTMTVEGGDLTTTSGGSIDYSGTPTVNIDTTGTLGGGTGSITFYNLSLGPNTAGTTTLSTDNLQIDNSLVVNSSHTFAMGTNSVTVGSTSISGSGDVTINGSTSQSSAGTFTILSNTSDAQLAGSGTLTVYNLTIGDGVGTVSVDDETNDVVVDAGGTFTITASATFKASSTAGFNVAGDWSNSGTFTANDGTVTLDAQDSGNTLSGTMTGSSAFNNLVFDTNGGSGEWSFSADATTDGDFTVTDAISVTAPSGTLTVKGDFEGGGGSPFVHNSGTVVLGGATGTTQEIGQATTFSTLTANATGSRVIRFSAGTTYTIDTNITLSGTDCDNLLVIRSTTAGTQFTIANSDTTPTSSYADYQDTNVTTNSISGTGLVDSGNNSGITFGADTCEGSSTNTDATGYSFQRKTFKDSTNSVHWMFFHDGDEIEIKYSSDSGTNWTTDSTLSYDTNDFSVWNASISSTEYVWLAVDKGDDIVVRRGTLSSNSITWDGTEITAFDGTGASDTYAHAYLSLDSSNFIWVGARYHDGTNYVFKAVRSDSTADSTWSSQAFGGTIAEQQLTDDQTNSNVFGNIVPLSSQDMYATFTAGTALEGCRWVQTSTEWQDSSGSSCVSTSGGGGEALRYEEGPVKIDDAGDPGALPDSTRHVVQTSTGTLYAVVNDGGSCEVWMSVAGETWTEQDASNNPTCSSSSGDGKESSVSVDSADDLHFLYWSTNSTVSYIKFTTSTNTFGTEEDIKTYSNLDSRNPRGLDITIDSNDVPHAVFAISELDFALDDNYYVEYANRVGGTWSVVTIESVIDTGTVHNFRLPSITINEDNIPEIAYIHNSATELTAALGNQNDATSFTLHDVDTDMNISNSVSIAVDQVGNTWIAYVDDTGGDGGTTPDEVSIVKHNDADAWSTWQSPVSTGNVGFEPSIAVITSDIYVFYEEDASDDIVYNKYDSGDATWLGETTLESDATAYQDVHVRWQSLNNNDGYLIDYVFSDGTDVYWNYLDARPVNIDDASDFGAMPGAGRQVVRDSNGRLFSALNDGGNLEMWRSTDGSTWTQRDSGTSIAVDSGGDVAMAIDSSDTIHVIFVDTNDISYITFSSDAWGTEETAESISSVDLDELDIAVDANDIPHVARVGNETINSDSTAYLNRIGGSWSRVVLEELSGELFSPSITLNEDNIPEVSYINDNDASLTAAVGDDNDPDTSGQWTLHDVDTDVNNVSGERATSIAVDHDGNTWIAYVDDTGGDGGTTPDEVTIVKHNDADAWTTWQTPVSTGTVGYEPSIAIGDGRDVYVFYETQSSGNADDIAYDVYDADAGSPSFAGETVLFAGTYQDVKAKWAFENNNYGTNKIDFLFSDGTDVFYSFLHLRRMPTKFADASNAGNLNDSGRQVVRTSGGVLYSAVVDEATGNDIQIWKSTDEGNTWSEQDSANSPGSTVTSRHAIAIDSTDTIHIIYGTSAIPADLNYETFDTSTDSFGGSPESVDTTADSNVLPASISIDSNDIPHIAYCRNATTDVVRYGNRIGGSWSLVDVESSVLCSEIDITISEDNIPEISYINTTDDDLTAAVGDDNDPDTSGQWTVHDVDADVNDASSERGTSIAIDSSGNTWIAYVDDTGGDDGTTPDEVTIVKHNDGDAWTTWQSSVTDSDVGYEPSIVIDGTDIYVFYEDDQDDIVYNKYNGTSWDGEKVIEMHGALQDTKPKWSFLNNYDSAGTHNGFAEIDYLYSDGTDVFYNRLVFGSTPGSQDAIDTVPANLSDNISAVVDTTNYDVHLVFIDDETTDQVSYKRWDNGTTSWDSTATLVADAADDNDAYATISINTGNRDLTAFWVDNSAGTIFYSQCDVSGASSECSADGDWAAETSWQTGTNTNVSSSYAESNEYFAQWTEGTGSVVTVEWDIITAAAETTFTLNAYRWYVDNDATNPTDPWSSVAGVDLAENTAITVTPVDNDPPNSTQELRLRVNFTVNNANLSATSQQFKIQFKAGTDGSCTTGSWTDVASVASSAWQFASSSVTDGATITGVLTDTDVNGHYAKSKPTTTNTNSATVGQQIEYDFHIIGSGSDFADVTKYSFRAVESDGSVFDAYTNCPTLTTEPQEGDFMRHGNVLKDGTEHGFSWAD